MPFRDRVDTDESGPPGVLGVLDAGYGYLREGGVAVAPIAAIGP